MEQARAARSACAITGDQRDECPLPATCWCRELSADSADALFKTAALKPLAPGETVCLQGEPCAFVHVVVEGMLSCAQVLSDGRRQIVSFLLEGDVLGHLEEQAHDVTATVITPARLWRVPRETLRALAFSDRNLHGHMCRSLTAEVVQAHWHETLLGRQTARERVASTLLMLLERAKDIERISGLVRLPMTRVDLADFLGLSFETVSRTFSRLKDERLIALPRHDLVQILDVPQLRRVAKGSKT